MRTRAQFRRALVMVLIVAGLSVPATVAAAAGSSGGQPVVPSQDFYVQPVVVTAPLTETEAEDLAQYARQLGVSVESLTDQFSGQESFSSVLSAIQARNQQSFVYAEWNSVEGDTGPLVVFNAPPKKADLRLLSTIGVPVHVLVVDAPSALDRDNAVETVAAQIGTNRQALVGADWRTSTINVELGSPTDRVPVSFDVIPNESASDTTPSGSAKSDAEVIASAQVMAGPFAIAVHAVEGNPLTLQYRGGVTYGSCTAGFVVATGATRGISTARHCTTLSSYDGGSFAAASTHYSTTADVRWTPSTAGSAQGTFQSNWGSFRTATGSGNTWVGAPVCHFGIATGYSCSTVVAVNQCNSGSVCGLVIVADNIAAPGDSGGPWFYGGVARGIHTGTCTYDGATRACFTIISRLTGMGVSIATG